MCRMERLSLSQNSRARKRLSRSHANHRRADVPCSSRGRSAIENTGTKGDKSPTGWYHSKQICGGLVKILPRIITLKVALAWLERAVHGTSS